MTAPVFLAEPGRLDGHGPGDVYVLDGTEARHAGTVQRRRAGERVDVVDGDGVRLACVIAAVEPGRLVLDVAERVERAKDLLETTGFGLDAIAGATGFRTQETLRHHFRSRTGVSPSAFRRAFGRVAA